MSLPTRIFYLRVRTPAFPSVNGQEGVDEFLKHSEEIVAILLDLTMPHLSGEEVYQEIRHIRTGVPVILSSGYNEQEATERFAGKGLAGFLQKPYRAQQLIQKIREILES